MTRAICTMRTARFLLRFPLAILDILTPLGYIIPNIIRIKGNTMFHKGLDMERIIGAAKDLIEECGLEKFSMRQLAESLGIKTASLYAHVESMESLLKDVGLLALKEQREFELKAIEGKQMDEAVLCLASSYRKFAKEHAELYRFIMKMQLGNDEELKKASEMVVEPAMKALNGYDMSEEMRMHYQRILRALMHGFISQEENGYFSHYPVDVEESYKIAVGSLIKGIHAEEAKKDEKR